MEPNPHLSAYPLAGIDRTTRMRFPPGTVDTPIDGPFMRDGPFTGDRSLAGLRLAERKTSAIGAVLDESPGRRRGIRLRAPIHHSSPRAFNAGTCVTRLCHASPLRFTSNRSRSVLRALIQDHQEVLGLSRSLNRYRYGVRVLPVVHFRYDTRTITTGTSPSCPMTSVIAPPEISLRTTNTHSAWHARGSQSIFCTEPQASNPISTAPAYSADREETDMGKLALRLGI